MDSFITWVGGKKSMRVPILERFPRGYDRYIEVFGGAAWILFAKKPEPFEVYNDYNSDLTNLFCVVKYQPLAFLKELGFLPFNSRQEFMLLMDWLKQRDYSIPYYQQEMKLAKRYLPELELQEYCTFMEGKAKLGNVRRAVAFYKVIRQSYASGCTSFNSQPVSLHQAFQTIWTANRRLNENGAKSKSETKLAEGTAGKGVIIENKSYAALIKQYDRPTAFAYIDPPYYNAENCYAAAFSKEDHYILRETAGQMQGKFMISYNDVPEIRELYKDFYIESFQRINNISQRYDPGNLYGELLIMNYQPETQPKQLSLIN